MAHTDDDDLLLVSEVSRLADPPVVTATVRWWADQGRLPMLRTPSGVRLFRRADVKRHLAERKQFGKSAGRRHE